MTNDFESCTDCWRGMRLPLFGQHRLPNISGVYRITNLVTGEFYLGGTGNLQSRQRSHVSNLIRGNHESKILQASFDRYGPAVFDISIVQAAASGMHARHVEGFLIFKLQPAFNRVGIRRNRKPFDPDRREIVPLSA